MEVVGIGREVLVDFYTFFKSFFVEAIALLPGDTLVFLQKARYSLGEKRLEQKLPKKHGQFQKEYIFTSSLLLLEEVQVV